MEKSREDAKETEYIHDSVHDFFADIPSAEIPNPQPSVSPIPVLPELGISLGLLALVFTATFITIPNAPSIVAENDVYVDTEVTLPTATEQYGHNAFENISLKAKGAIVWDVKEQKLLFNKNGDIVLPLASVTKLMTALVAYELLDPEEKVTISAHDLQTIGDSGLLDGEIFSVQDLVDLTLISSSNDGATALGSKVASIIDPTKDPEALFIDAMNMKAKELGLSKTYFLNSAGLDVSRTEAGAYGTARDMALLMEYIITKTPDAVALTSLNVKNIANAHGNYHIAENTNEVVGAIDGLIASKTGSTDLAGGNLVIAFDAGLNHPVIVSVLGSTYSGRFDDTLLLVEETQKYLAAQ